ncbi:MAG: YHS domain-containing (seleno)protein [Calditrichia bacterium]
MKSKRMKIIAVVLIGLIGLAYTFAKIERVSPLSWAHNEINQPMFSNEAINGYDPVAYFTKQMAVIGDEKHTYSWRDAAWYFSSEENKNLFINNPEKFAPQFGGFCAFAVSKGFTANSSANSFEIIDHKLYLFNGEDVKTEWKANFAENLAKCEANWDK